MSAALNIAHLGGWIGRTERVSDTVTPRLMREYAAMLNLEVSVDVAPLALHWCLAPLVANASAIALDGHPVRGNFLPPVPLPRRMWAGGRLQFHQRLYLGDYVQRMSRIADVTVKEGRTGTLCFVSVDHDIAGPRGLVIAERQDIVYRAIEAPAARPTSCVRLKDKDLPIAQWTREMVVDPILLFRFSALTFNSHRIHYDRSYAIGVEKYPGLVVHGPLQATWLLEYASDIFGHTPKEFVFRSIRPLFDFEKFKLCAREGSGILKLWIEADGVLTMEATAQC